RRRAAAGSRSPPGWRTLSASKIALSGIMNRVVRIWDREDAMNDAALGPGAIERPVLANEPGDYWGSDAVALMLRELDLPYVALNPGASYRGLHDSLVNLLGNRDPQMLLCLHEEHAVAIAHGYAKVTGRPMGAIVHSNVGLMHATMAIFN